MVSEPELKVCASTTPVAHDPPEAPEVVASWEEVCEEERLSLGWLNRERRLSKDYERLEESSEAFLYLGMSRLMLRRLA